MRSSIFLQAAFVVLSLAAIAQGERRVIGGHDAPNHKYPYLISLRGETGHLCAGSILNKRWILTVAHCVENCTLNTCTISAGTNFLNESGIVYETEDFVPHEQYVHHYQYDIALVRVKKEIVFSDSVKAIRLPKKELQDYKRSAVFAGWGYTTWERKDTSNALQEIDFKLLATEECQKVYPKKNISKRHICTMNKRGEGFCNADSGGPLVVDGVQVGIASHSDDPCGDSADVWTCVFSYRDWIFRTIQRYDKI